MDGEFGVDDPAGEAMIQEGRPSSDSVSGESIPKKESYGNTLKVLFENYGTEREDWSIESDIQNHRGMKMRRGQDMYKSYDWEKREIADKRNLVLERNWSFFTRKVGGNAGGGSRWCSE